jgi:hypothetical protein
MARSAQLYLTPSGGGIFWWHVTMGQRSNPVVILNRPGGDQEWTGEIPDVPVYIEVLAVGASRAAYQIDASIDGAEVALDSPQRLINGKGVYTFDL